ncbi:hypothetical protein [Rhodococcus sp. NPDC058514]|uniref:hypothetical protein n=1 Tax=unclassified Rhodococcus (in: high G+C Gram-positive bacteria) TaxID=192944 RepID=UPI00365D2D1F
MNGTKFARRAAGAGVLTGLAALAIVATPAVGSATVTAGTYSVSTGEGSITITVDGVTSDATGIRCWAPIEEGTGGREFDLDASGHGVLTYTNLAGGTYVVDPRCRDSENNRPNYEFDPDSTTVTVTAAESPPDDGGSPSDPFGGLFTGLLTGLFTGILGTLFGS